MGMEGGHCGLTDVLSRYLLRGTEKNHKKKLSIVDDPESKKVKCLIKQYNMKGEKC
jgi:hypothetical protein